MLRFLLAAIAAVMVPASASAVELIVNGGFESDLVGNPCCTTTPPTFLTGWTATPNVNVVNGTFSSNPYPTQLAFEGAQYLDLVGQGGTGSITQTFATVVGQTYNLSFAYSHNLFNGTPSASANYLVTGAQAPFGGLLTHNTGSNSNLNWLSFSGSFVASGASATLSFINLTGGANEGILLDAISVSAVPEPEVWAMMLIGFGAIGFQMRRRRGLRIVTA